MSDEIKLELEDAYNRILSQKTIYLDKGTSLSAANVIRETGRNPDQVKMARYPALRARIREEKAKLALQQNKRLERTRRTKRSLQKQLADAKMQRDHMASVIASQNEYILTLLDEIEKLKGSVVNINN